MKKINKTSSSSVFSWKTTEEELKNQIDNYETLKITQSCRGISVIITLSLLALSFILAFVGFFSLEDLLFGLIIYLPILFFVYKGHRWAIVSLMILWTFEKGYQLFIGGGIMALFWWAIIIPYFYKALKVENERKKRSQNPLSAARFCGNCGDRISKNASFCNQCGRKLNNN